MGLFGKKKEKKPDEIDSKEKSLKKLEEKIEVHEKETERLGQLEEFFRFSSTIDDLVHASVTLCQKISLYQSSDNIDNKEEKIIDNICVIESDILFLESKIKQLEEWKNRPKEIKYLQEAIERIMEAKSKYKIDS
jgi:hypothetical protein